MKITLTMFALTLAMLYRTSRSYSACDEVNVIFLIDTESIKNKGNNIINFISKIASDGTSEHAGFSIIVYGDNVPNNMDINLMTLLETGTITDRRKEESKITARLETKFTQIAMSNVDNVKSIGLLEAFNAGNSQEKGVKKHHTANYIGAGLHDDENEYFIFNYNGIDVFDTSDICELFKHVERTENKETVHVLLGQTSDLDSYVKQLHNRCKSKIIETQTVFNFDNIISGNGEFDEKQMELIFSITCPAEVDASYEFGSGSHMDLGNHVQWIDPETVIKCVLIDDNSYTPNLSANSYILIKDIIDDDSTFKKNDYLLAEKETLEKLIKTDPSCCDLMPVKIYKIVDDNDNNLDNSYVIRRLYVRIPSTPWEYISKSHVTGKIGISPETLNLCDDIKNNDNNNDNNYNYRRLRVADADLDANVKHLSLIGGPIVWAVDGEYERTSNVEKTWDKGQGTITATGSGDIYVDWGLSFEFDVWLNFKYYWDLIPGEIDVEFSIEGFFEANAWFNVKISTELTVKWEKILYWSKTYKPVIGGIPIIIRPFFQMDATVKTIPFHIHSGVECTFRYEFKKGYWIYTSSLTDSWDSGSIDETETRKKECSKKLGIGDEDNDILNSCDPIQLGFDVILEAYVGVTLYEVIAAWLRAELIIPFRIEIPELSTSICSSNSYECSANSLRASFKINKIELSFYFGYERGGIWDIIGDFLDPDNDDTDDTDIFQIDFAESTETLIAGPLELLGITSLGCVQLSDILPNRVTSHIGSLCCSDADPFANVFSAKITDKLNIQPSYLIWMITFIPMIFISIGFVCICGRLSTNVSSVPRIDDAEFNEVNVRKVKNVKGWVMRLKAVITAGSLAAILVIVINALFIMIKYPACPGDEYTSIIIIISWITSCIGYLLIRKIDVTYFVLTKISITRKVFWYVFEKILLFNVALAFVCIVFKPIDDCYY
eukprot:322392_1